MGLAVRIIPTLLKRGSQLVKGRRFSADRVVGHVLQAARIHQARGVDELCILDIDATPSGRGPDFEAIEELTRECFMPLTIGGGVRTLDEVDRLLRAGADKVAIKTAMFKNPRFLTACADRFGSQAVVAVLDEYAPYPLVRSTAAYLEGLGAGEILLTAVDQEGTMAGMDCYMIEEVARTVSVPVIAHGGCGTPQHALDAVRAGASAVAIGAMFQFTEETPQSVARYLKANGVEVRL